VEALFEQAMDLSGSEQQAFLADACGDDPELAAYIRSLLSRSVDDDTAIADIIDGAVRGFEAETGRRSADRSGERIGRYRLVRRIGAGGMAVVYLADRADDQYEQRVAIKLVSHRVVDPAIDERTRFERQILATLDHPNIARLLDGGTTEDGLPYIVMEHIDGVPVDVYCDRRRLSLDERIDLFERICSAVHYAHQNLIVHRDIKPSNILVTDDGIPKLLDFGIAKQIDAHGMPTDGLTRDGFAMMTPENATPEQLLGNPVTTATDVYALGVLLYRLLTGYAPLPIRGRPPAEFARIICNTPAEPPSRLVARQLSSAEADDRNKLVSRSDARQTTPERLIRRLRGDIDNILLVALRKEPERRYRSVNQFAEDLRLHRQSQPVIARPDTWSYRTGKFIRRHYAGVASSALLVGVIVAFSALTWVQNQQIRRERDTAREVSQFLEEIFMEPDPARSRGLDITAKEILANGADKLRRQLADRPQIQAAMMETIGRVYFNLGEYDSSVDMHSESLRLRESVLGEDHVLVAQSQNELAETLIRQGEYGRAAELLTSAMRINESTFDGDSKALAQNLHNLAELQLAEGRLDAAESAARRSIAIHSTASAGSPLEYAEATALLARILQVKGDLGQTEKLLREAIAILRDNVADDHPLMAYYLQNLGVLLRSRGNLVEAEATLNESIDIKRRVLGREHDSLAGTLVILGALQHQVGDFEQAEASLRSALDIHRSARGAEHPFVAYDMTSLGMLLHDSGRLDEAEAVLRGALDIYEASLDRHHQYIGSTLTELGAVLNTRGYPELALPLLKRAAEIRARDYATEHPLRAATLAVYGDSLSRLGRYDEAEGHLVSGLEVLEPRKDRRTRPTLLALVRLYEASGRPDEAARYRALAARLDAAAMPAQDNGKAR
jgi:serine/threonine-protein kinase